MKRIKLTTKQLIIEKEEAYVLRREFEAMFFRLDSSCGANSYYGEMIECKFPKVYELFRELA